MILDELQMIVMYNYYHEKHRRMHNSYEGLVLLRAAPIMSGANILGRFRRLCDFYRGGNV